MRCIGNVWDLGKGEFKSWQDILQSFGLAPNEEANYALLQRQLPGRWLHLLIIRENTASLHDWIGVFDADNSNLPNLVVCATDVFMPLLFPVAFQMHIPNQLPCFSIGLRSWALIPILALHLIPHLAFRQTRRVRIIHIEKG
jgi:hypothetical protein